MKLLFLILSTILSVGGCTGKKDTQIDSSDNNVDSMSHDSLVNATIIRDTMSCDIPVNDSIVSDSIVRVLVGDTTVNGCKEPILSLRRQKNAHETKWIKPLQTIKMQSFNDINVYFRYAQPINGYTVTCRFMPYGPKSETGYIIMRFQGKKSEFLYIKEDKHSSFYTLYLMFYKGKDIIWKNGDIYVLDYISPTFKDSYKEYNNNSPLGYYAPFQFFDIDFDGKKELLINDFCMLQQGNEYEIYKIKGKELEPIHNRIPFSMLDNMTRFDIDKKRIVTYIHDGAFLSSYIFFTRKSQYKSHIKELPKFNWDYMEKMMAEYAARPNYFSIDSISEIVGDTIFEYHRNGTKLELVKCRIGRNK